MNVDRGEYEELDNAVAESRERRETRSRVSHLQGQVRGIDRRYAGEIELLKTHVRRLENSQNDVLARMEALEGRSQATPTRPYNQIQKLRMSWWRRWLVAVSNLFKLLWRKLINLWR